MLKFIAIAIVKTAILGLYVITVTRRQENQDINANFQHFGNFG
jgi:hypothetical protein